MKILIFVALLCTSASSVFIRVSGMPPVVIAFYRMAASSLFLSVPLLTGRGNLKTVSRRDLLLCIASGAALAMHFATWIASVSMTSVAASTVLVSCSPIFVAAANTLITRKRPKSLLLICLTAAIAGTAVVALGGSDGAGGLSGNLLALAGAFFVSIYLMIGQEVRKRVNTAEYAFLVFTVAAVVLFFGCLVFSEPLWPYDAKEFLIVTAMALVCSIGGHTLNNMLLKRFGATVISLASLCEPLSASLLAWLILSEAPPITAFIGGAIILASLCIYILKSGTDQNKKL